MPSEEDKAKAGDLASSSSPARPHFQLIAHRGLSALAPENTLEAFDLALERGFHHFETDVQLTRDGAAVVLHDEAAAPGGRTLTLSAAAEGAEATPPTPPRPVAECTLAELRQMDAAAWFWRAGGPRAMLPPDAPAEAVAAAASAKDAIATTAPTTPPPTLDEVLLRYRGKAHIHLELKSKQPGLARVVLDALERTGWRGDLEERAAAAEAEADDEPSLSGCGSVPGLTLTSFHLEQLLRVAEELDHDERGGAASLPPPDPPPSAPNRRCSWWLRRHWLVQELDAPTLQAIAEVPRGGLTGVCPRANAATREGVEAARRALRESGGSGCERPTEVRAWGVRSLALLKRAVEVGADGATVNWPHLCSR
jgi:glycerophosphoryl diester phosphodiesterase